MICEYARIVKLAKWEIQVSKETIIILKKSQKLCIVTYIDLLEQRVIVEKKNLFFFVDDYSRMMTVMYLKEKSKAFEKFKWYLAREKKEIRKKLKCLRLDRGGEFISNEFNEFYIKIGIMR